MIDLKLGALVEKDIKNNTIKFHAKLLSSFQNKSDLLSATFCLGQNSASSFQGYWRKVRNDIRKVHISAHTSHGQWSNARNDNLLRTQVEARKH